MRFSLNKIYTSLFFIICFSLSFIGDKFYAIPNGANIALALMFPFVINWSQLVKRLNKKPVIWFAIFVFFIFFKSVFMSYFIEDISQIKKLFQVLLLLILSFGLKEKSVGYLKLGIVLGTLTACVYSLIKICIIVFQTGVFNFTKGPLINETLPVQRLYLGLLCTFSLIFVLERLLKNRKKYNFFLAVFFIFFTFLIAGRIAVISVLFIIIYYVFTFLKSYMRYIAVLSIFVLISITAFTNNNLSKRLFHSEDNFRTTYFEKIEMHEPRFLIWKYSFEILKETNLITGNGYSKTTEKLVNEYKNISQEKKRNWFIDKEFNTHNQYLDILISQGVLAALIFIVFLVQVFKVAKKSHTNILLLTSMLIYMTVYNNFHRLIGVYLFSLILIVILSKDNSKKTIE
ncbi:O-antigen ligase family protein [Flavobacteriaceae bacterium]|nr:O-antigen ligase family protein [Flavobacteriaceae bacterium]MDB4133617.1 O-antigen ligase family protein [Flavobacteriaceae bacterium]